MGSTLIKIEHPLDTVWDVLQELVHERRHVPYAYLYELEKAINQKWKEIDDHTIKKAILQ